MRRRFEMIFALCLIACDGAGPSDAGSDVPIGARCADIQTIETCDGIACTSVSCRGDEVCSDAACIPWTEAELFADFTLEHGEGRVIAVTVLPGGFPRTQVEALRFSFGDGVAGWGETLRHEYAAPGVYPVELEVRLTGHRVLRASKLAIIEPPGAHNPLVLTIDELPDYLNGSLPLPRNGGTPDDPSDDTLEPFTVLAPRSGFTIDVTLLEDPAHPIDRATLSLVADVAVGTNAPGTELAPRLAFEEGATLAVARARWIVDEPFPVGRATLTLRARTTGGAMHERTLAFDVTELTPDRDPFDRPMVWLFRTDTDFFTTRASEVGVSRYALVSTEAPNGRPDLVEELELVGAQGPDPEVNALYLALLFELLRAETYRYYGIGPDGAPHDGIAFTIFWQGEPGAPDPATFDATAGQFSMMRFGGVFDGFLGFSGFAPWNEGRVDDSTADRGVATASILSTLVGTPVVSTALDPIKPGFGAPVGTDPADAIVLAPGFDPYGETDETLLARYRDLRGIARYIALAISAVAAHEMGHAMGLVPNGVPPDGFLGGVLDVAFVNPGRTNSHHADLPGLNLMQAGGDTALVIEEAVAQLELPRSADLLLLAEILALENRLDPYSRAYLQRRLTHASFDLAPSGYRVGCLSH